MQQLCADLAAETASLDEIVSAPGIDLSTPTPAEGWSIGDQLSHLWFFDERANRALTDPATFAVETEALLATMAATGGTDPSVEPGRAMAPGELLDAWRAERARLIGIAVDVDPSTRVPWYGPAMGARSFVTARLMETWAHGQDVVDALGADRPPTDRLRHVAHIGIGARRYSFAVRGLPVPEAPILVELTGPSGDVWTWGGDAADGAADRVAGSALEFCLVVTQRRHLDDTSLDVSGDVATAWMSIAQAFAGPPGPGRAPLPDARQEGVREGDDPSSPSP